MRSLPPHTVPTKALCVSDLRRYGAYDIFKVVEGYAYSFQVNLYPVYVPCCVCFLLFNHHISMCLCIFVALAHLSQRLIIKIGYSGPLSFVRPRPSTF